MYLTWRFETACVPQSYLTVRYPTLRLYFTQKHFILVQSDDFHCKPSSRRTPQAPRAVPQAAGRRQQRPASGSLGHGQPHQVLCACGIPANLKIDVLFSFLLTGQPCTVKTRRRLDWEFWLYVLCKPKYGTHKPWSAGARHPYQWLVKSWAINER